MRKMKQKMNHRCIDCKHSNSKFSKVADGLLFNWCRKYRNHFSPNDSCEYFENMEAANE